MSMVRTCEVLASFPAEPLREKRIETRRVRLSTFVEDAADIIEDVEQALAGV
jgi:O-acetylhomoserine/O-acetylserine sulfhydrylase-like pyridoxal-dependent enzyme